jgi:transcriptional regulator with PAS, ATPase and Fis domain
MRMVAWTGTRPPAAVERALRDKGIGLARREKQVSARVVRTAAGTRTPSAPRERRWIWYCDGAIANDRRVEAVLRGAYDVIDGRSGDAAAQLAARLDELLVPETAPPTSDVLVTISDASRQVIAKIAQAAPTSMAVLLTGETGTGKEVIARQIHAWSPRAAKPFIPINCAAIPNELMEAELFGYARGAFSGAVQAYEGQLAAAAGGTVFLDEIHDTPPALQVKLLRVLEDRVVSRLGENTWRRIDFRIVAATNRDLGPLIESGVFGADLYERLAIVTIELPPLRERLEDLPGLVDQFIERFHAGDGAGISRVRGIRPDALRALAAYRWPGNVRELRNVVWETLVYKRAGDEIIPADLPHRVLRPGTTAATAGLVDRGALARRIAARALDLKGEIAALERTALTEALALAGGNAAEAARLLGTVGRGHARDPGGTVRAMLRRLRRSTASR